MVRVHLPQQKLNNMSKVQQVVKHLIDKMLEKHGVDMDYVKANPTINGEQWFHYYTWTSEEETAFIEYAKKYIRKKLHMTEYGASKEVGMFILNWGLKVA